MTSLNYIKGGVLDFGCGTGHLAKYIPKKDYIGVDIDQNSLYEAEKNFPSHTFFNINKVKFNKINRFGPFDTIVLLAVIEHIKEPYKLLNQLSNLISRNGQIIITTPHPTSDIIHRIGSKMVLFSRVANMQHEKYYNYNQMKKICSRSNLKIFNYKRFLLGVNQLFIIRQTLI